MALKVAKRGSVPPFIVMDVLQAANERAAAGQDVLHLEIGQPGCGAPSGAIAAVEAALRSDRMGYTDACGIRDLRLALARHYRDWYGLDLDPARILVTTGSSAGFLISFLTAFEAGDRVALASPGYPAYRNILRALDIEPVLIEAGPEDRFQPTPDLLDRVEGQLDGLILASPSNPTGTMLDCAAMKALVDYCEARGLRLVSDEIYHGITYSGRAVSALELSEKAIVVNSFSKYFAMTGWRLGWLVLPEDMMRPAECLTQNLFISAPAVSQHAGIGALASKAELDAVVAGYARNRDHLLDMLPKAGFGKLAPADGAFYLYADVSEMTEDSQALCSEILRETGVALSPGVDFDPLHGRRFLRFSFAGRESDIVTAGERLSVWAAAR